jgi:hypothetical protein
VSEKEAGRRSNTQVECFEVNVIAAKTEHLFPRSWNRNRNADLSFRDWTAMSH